MCQPYTRPPKRWTFRQSKAPAHASTVFAPLASPLDLPSTRMNGWCSDGLTEFTHANHIKSYQIMQMKGKYGVCSRWFLGLRTTACARLIVILGGVAFLHPGNVDMLQSACPPISATRCLGHAIGNFKAQLCKHCAASKRKLPHLLKNEQTSAKIGDSMGLCLYVWD